MTLQAEPPRPTTGNNITGAGGPEPVGRLTRFPRQARFAWKRMASREARFATRAPVSRPSWRRCVMAAACLVLLAFLAFDPLVGQRAAGSADFSRRLAQQITGFGKSGLYLYPLGIFLIGAFLVDWTRLSRRIVPQLFCATAAAWFLFASVAGSGLIATSLKQLIGRARPALFYSEGMLSFHSLTMDPLYASFPSGHSTTAGAITMGIALLFPRLRIAMFVIALWFGFSRVMVRAHYASDVIAGLTFGAWFSYYCAYRMARAGTLFAFSAKGFPVPRSGFRLAGYRRWTRMRDWVDTITRRFDATREPGQSATA